MNNRRNFLKKTGAGVLAAVAGPSFFSTAAGLSPLPDDGTGEKKKIRIGIIGAENTHTVLYGKMYNIEKRFPGVEVSYVWGETEDFARHAMKEGGIPRMVKDPREMLGKIDALIVDHRHPRYHLPAARPFVEEGVSTFIDKPFCYRAAEGADFLRMAREKGTPVTSYSAVAQSNATFDIRDQVREIKDIEHVVRYGVIKPAMQNNWGGIFFYGVHSVQPLMYIFGEDIREVRITENGDNYTASMAYENGLLATLVFTRKYYGWQTFVTTGEGIRELTSRVKEPDPPRNYQDMIKMFRTGELPRTYQSILNGVSVLEALEKSVKSQQWEEVRYVKI
jgi:predicted dehydrogenase